MRKKIFKKVLFATFALALPHFFFAAVSEDGSVPHFDDSPEKKTESEDEKIHHGIESEDVDDLFDDSQDKSEDVNTNIDYAKEFEQTKGVDMHGNFSAKAGVAVGSETYDFKAFKYSGGANVNLSASFDFRPDRYFRLYAKLTAEVDPNKFEDGWGDLVIERGFADYTINEYFYMSLGSFPIKWGEGQLFSPANLLNGIDSGFNFKFAFPLIADGVNLIFFTKTLNKEKTFSLQNFNFAGNIDKVIRTIRFSAGFSGNKVNGLDAYLSTKLILNHFEPYFDFVVNVENITSDCYATYLALGGVYFHFGNFYLTGEYYFDFHDREIYSDHNFGATVAYRRIFDLPLTFFCNVEHTLFDNTGGAVATLSYSGFRDFTFQIGIPFLWGKDGGRYTQSVSSSNFDISDFDSSTEFYQSWDKRVSVFFTISLSKDF